MGTGSGEPGTVDSPESDPAQVWASEGLGAFVGKAAGLCPWELPCAPCDPAQRPGKGRGHHVMLCPHCSRAPGASEQVPPSSSLHRERSHLLKLTWPLGPS